MLPPKPSLRSKATLATFTVSGIWKATAPTVDLPGCRVNSPALKSVYPAIELRDAV